MLCQSCSKNKATTHVKTVINGETKEYMLCNDCAEKLGYKNLFNSFNMDLSDFLGGLFSQESPLLGEPKSCRCSECGSTFADIANTGKVGCANCYSTFYENMVPSIQRIHGSTIHKGKVPSESCGVSKIKNDIENKNMQLKKLIDEQEFEKAAKLRDEIKELKKEMDNNE